MEVGDNLDFKHVLDLVKNTYMMITRNFIQMILDRTALIFTIKIQIMKGI